eukprot:7492765-Pyramimonas_sp.AAC.1
MAYRSLNLRKGRNTLDNTANAQIRLRESGWLTFVDQKDRPSLEMEDVEIDNPELGHELNG